MNRNTLSWGPITPKMLETMEIPWELFPSQINGIGPALDRATAYMGRDGAPICPWVMQKGHRIALRASSQAVGRGLEKALRFGKAAGTSAAGGVSQRTWQHAPVLEPLRLAARREIIQAGCTSVKLLHTRLWARLPYWLQPDYWRVASSTPSMIGQTSLYMVRIHGVCGSVGRLASPLGSAPRTFA